jgi:RNA polymerase subunit RPABC4/transcription elongation factor Spt4
LQHLSQLALPRQVAVTFSIDLVQAKPKDRWKKLVGMDNSIQAQFLDQETSVVVNVGSGKWIDKAAAAGIGAFVFAPLLVTAAIGAWMSKKLPEELFDHLERFVVSGGKTSIISMSSKDAISESEVVCPKCRAKNQSGTRFCNSCGEKLLLECKACGANIVPGTKFCNSCGANIAEQIQLAKESSIVRCAACDTVIPDGVKFCPECGTVVPVKVDEGMAACPKCLAVVPENTKFCPNCGTVIPAKIIPTCPKCNFQIQPDAKFCPECGAAV